MKELSLKQTDLVKEIVSKTWIAEFFVRKPCLTVDLIRKLFKCLNHATVRVLSVYSLNKFAGILMTVSW